MGLRLFHRRAGVPASIVLAAALLAPAAQAGTPAQTRDFFRAVQMDDARTVRNLMGKAVDPNAPNPLGGEPALVVAVREGAMQVVQALLADPGVQVDAPALNGNTALMMAAYKRNPAAAEALLARGAAVNRPGWTPLHYAAASGDDAIARMLLQHGARVDAPSPPASGSFTPLMMAAREGHPDSARLLLAQGADTALKNGEGLTAAQIAERAGHGEIAAAISAHVSGKGNGGAGR
jgi:ankyrin repeat protein